MLRFGHVRMDESLKIRLLKAVGNDSAMQAILASMMERTHAEFCAFHTERDRELAYVMIEGRELSARLPELREKLRNAYRMFTNGFGAQEEEPIERIFCRRSGSNVAYLVAGTRIESYFLVPLTFGSKVRGVLFFGSIRKEAFGRSDIAVFRSLADEGEDGAPLVFRVGGDREVLERILEGLPSGAALVSPDGRIVSANRSFGQILELDGETPESVYEVGTVSCFSLHGVWDEFSILQRDVIDREIEGNCVPERYLSVSWTRLDNLSEDVGSLVIVRDATPAREERAAREETVAMVAHELRTPLAALKSSLAIVEAGGAAGAGRFLANAMRTVDRLGRLVDSLIDSSTARIDERALAPAPHRVRAFLDDVSALFVEPMRKKGIAFSIRVDERSAVLTFDRDRIEQVLQNLLANSMRHVPAGGSISIEAAPRDRSPRGIVPDALLGALPPLAFADLAVRDSGSGIPAEVAGAVNADGGASNRPGRSSKGLGLVIAKRLVRLHGGSLVIEEGARGGSAVHLYLPVDPETARVVQRCRDLESRLEEMLARGLAPAVAFVRKAPGASWEGAAGSWHRVPVINPPRGVKSGEEALLWPLSDTCAIALSARITRTGETPSAWATAPGEGGTLGELLSAALERLERDEPAGVMKGATA
jgi:signal transduction histidine kinase